MNIPTQLTDDQAMEITKLLLDARKYLRDAGGLQSYKPHYARSSSQIADLLRSFGVDSQ